MSTLYRDPLASLRERVAERRAEAERKRPSAAERDMLSDAQDARLGELERAARALEGTTADVASLTALEQALSSLTTAYDECLKSLATMLRLPQIVDSPQNVGPPPPWVVEEPWHRRFSDNLRLLLSETSSEIAVQRVGDHAYLARATYEEAPFFLRFALRIPRGLQFASDLLALQIVPGGSSLEVLLRTSAPDAAPRIFLQQATLLDRAKLLVGLTKEAKTNDQAFDETFLVDAPEPLAQFVFTGKVRGALLQMHEASLLVQNGYVEARTVLSRMPVSADLRAWVSMLLGLRERFSVMRADVRTRRGTLEL